MPVVVLREKERQNRYISVVSRPSKRISKYHKLLLLLLRACHPNAERACERTNDPPSVCVRPFVSQFAFAILNGERKTFFRCLKRVRHFRPQFSCHRDRSKEPKGQREYDDEGSLSLSLSLHSAAFVFATRARSNDGFFDDDAISLSRD